MNKSIKDRQIYVYSTSHLTPTERVKFFYALKGRNGKPGILDTTQSIFLAKSVLSVLHSQSGEIEQFLKTWDCNFSVKKVKPSDKPTHAIVRYSTTHLNATERVKFVYAVHGRGSSEGFLKYLKLKFGQRFQNLCVQKLKNLKRLMNLVSPSEHWTFWKV